MAMGKVFRVFEKKVVESESPYSILLDHRNKSESILFESDAVAILSQQETEAVIKQYTKILDAYACLGVLQLNVEDDKTLLFLVTITGCVSVGKIGQSEVFRVTQTNFTPLHGQAQDEERTSEVRKVLNSNTFYFSWSTHGPALDITLCAQRTNKTSSTDNRFFWNRMLQTHLIRFGVDVGDWLVKVMCGSVEIRTVYVGHRQARAAIISRLSSERAGTRFIVRGVNDDGHVANFVETEQVIYVDDEISSYVQVRGSVPLFWEQPGVQVGSHKVKMSRSAEASSAAFEKHFKILKQRYGHQVVVNLLGTSLVGSKEGEGNLSQCFQTQHKLSKSCEGVPHVIFDYHQECKGGNTKALSKLLTKVEKKLNQFSTFYCKGDEVLSEQKGTFRTNCLDCLDRTNCVQTFFGIQVLEKQLQLMNLGEKQTITSRFEEVFRQMWINNGNEISKIYAGTGAIQGGSKIMDGARSAARTIQNNLLDSGKQEAFDVLLMGHLLHSEVAHRTSSILPSFMMHAPKTVLFEMYLKSPDYLKSSKMRVSVGTYNVNGGKHFRSVVYKDQSLTDWLLDAPSLNGTQAQGYIDEDSCNNGQPIDIYAIGFEEIVDLNASNIMAASNENAKAWAIELQKVLSRDNEYVMLTYIQLVGVCLYLFIRPEHIPYVKDLAVDSVKTGLGGATGNKGAVAIRFTYYSTSVCFLCSHFAAGQSQVTERNADYAEITKRLLFPMGRNLDCHDYIFWCGDFNYRVDMDKDEMKELIKQNELDDVLENDQLKKEQDEGNVFQDYNEGPVMFAPTYKYDLFSTDYDTSEKCRAPAWTDRVLWKRQMDSLSEERIRDWSAGNLIYYGRAELKQSDHRPVIAIIDCAIYDVDEAKRDETFAEIIKELGPPDATIIIHIDDEQSASDSEFLNPLLQELGEIGEVILVRFVEETMWVTFRDSRNALKAVAKGFLQVGDKQLQMTLRTSNWKDLHNKEIQLWSDNTVPLYDSNIPIDTDEHHLKKPPKVPPPPSPCRSPCATPTRPPLPNLHKPKAGVISIPKISPKKETSAPSQFTFNEDCPKQRKESDQVEAAAVAAEDDNIPMPSGPPPPPPPSAPAPAAPPTSLPPLPQRNQPSASPAAPPPIPPRSPQPTNRKIT
ncbi:synaptojanin-1 [Nilaparvata lugens]|uniref:synaptojanin-1 n=1 Tax=Nilaparvata lugens TaxID=108931 RepID=UPI00193CCED1|nr:synaptojanin-1 [Nilaparvata lugens]